MAGAFTITHAQENENTQITSIELEEAKAQIMAQEKQALKERVQKINEQLDNGEISFEESVELKKEAAEKHALNIENRLVILENEWALNERNNGRPLVLNNENEQEYDDDEFVVDINGKHAFTFKSKKKEIRYDRRTFSDPVLAIGLNNVLIDGADLEDTPYKIGGSRFVEIGWQWRSRVFQNTNWLRFNYGINFQFNALKPKGNQIFTIENGETVLADFEYDLDKSKFRVDNMVFPMHFEFGGSTRHEYKDHFRYSLRRQFRVGVGGYGGFNLSSRQKLKYTREGEQVKDKLKRGYEVSDFVYGLSAYAGFDGVLLYAKYDLNPLFKDALIEQNNISVGLRFDL